MAIGESLNREAPSKPQEARTVQRAADKVISELYAEYERALATKRMHEQVTNLAART